jgi:hypothetical protein
MRDDIRQKISFFVIFSIIFSWRLHANTLYFVPTKLRQFNPEAFGMLYVWPHYDAILAYRKDKNNYQKAVFGECAAQQLSEIFRPPPNSNIKIVRDHRTNQWGLTIPGGVATNEKNIILVEPMLNAFISCLETLEQEELDKMEAILYQPASYNRRFFDNDIYDEKYIAAKMLVNYRANLCGHKITSFTKLLKSKLLDRLDTLLTGHSVDGFFPIFGIMPFTLLFGDFLFAEKGLWAMTTKEVLQQFITDRLREYPAVTRDEWYTSNYDNFLEFIKITSKSHALQKNQYLSIAKNCGISTVREIFDPFLLKECVQSKRLQAVNIHIKETTSTFFLPGDA